MINNIKEFFSSEINNSDGDKKHQQNLAAASLMVEVMVIDQETSDKELTKIKGILESQFELKDHEIQKLLELARQEVKDATSLYQFTRLINDHFDYQKKKELIGSLWHIAFADDVLDKHEEAIIRRIADLIYISHSDFIKTKKIAKS
ncbi:MAG: TerB family tellurite resistance protein [Cellvibrionales bacterium]|nr:TerB family tellurite resistance protein [Cellvibrionales bacterium]